jgi:hypothetical protein
MSELSFSCQRAIYLFDVPVDHVETALARYIAPVGRKRRVSLALSEPHDRWQVAGMVDALPEVVLHELAWAFFDADDSDDFDLDKLAREIDIPDDSIVIVQYVPGQPQQCYYTLYQTNDNFDVVFTGRRDDGKGVRIDIVEESVKVQKDTTRLTLPVVEYLRSRGVPEMLMPGADGIVFTPVKRLAVAVNIDDRE